MYLEVVTIERSQQRIATSLLLPSKELRHFTPKLDELLLCLVSCFSFFLFLFLFFGARLFLSFCASNKETLYACVYVCLEKIKKLQLLSTWPWCEAKTRLHNFSLSLFTCATHAVFVTRVRWSWFLSMNRIGTTFFFFIYFNFLWKKTKDA